MTPKEALQKFVDYAGSRFDDQEYVMNHSEITALVSGLVQAEYILNRQTGPQTDSTPDCK